MRCCAFVNMPASFHTPAKRPRLPACKPTKKKTWHFRKKEKVSKLPPPPPGHKRCTACFREFDDSHFISKLKSRKPTKRCKSCRAINVKSKANPTTKVGQMHALYTNIKQFTLHNYVCANCKKPLRAKGGFDFAHIVPEPKVHRLSHYHKFKSRKAFLAEHAKCQPLCRPCHEAKTSTDHQDRRDMPAHMLGL